MHPIVVRAQQLTVDDRGFRIVLHAAAELELARLLAVYRGAALVEACEALAKFATVVRVKLGAAEVAARIGAIVTARAAALQGLPNGPQCIALATAVVPRASLVVLPAPSPFARARPAARRR